MNLLSIVPLTIFKVDVDTSGGAVSGDKSGIQIPSSAFNTLSTRNREKIAKGTLNLYREPKIFDVSDNVLVELEADIVKWMYREATLKYRACSFGCR